MTGGGYTLVELIIAVGLFALVMTLASGAYFLMINMSAQAQGNANGINNLAFALESMTRTLRTGTLYSCGTFGVCDAAGDSSISFKDSTGAEVTYSRGVQGPDGSIGAIIQNGTTPITDPTISISSLMFYVTGTGTVASGDFTQPYVTVVISGTVAGKTPQSFTIETGSAMRGIDLNVTQAPVENPSAPTCTLTADSGTIISGGSVKLSWVTTNTTSFSIDHGIGTVTPAAAGFTVVMPSSSGTYVGTATNAGGSATCSVQVTVTSQ